MVTVDDATYVAMRDNLYKWDAWAASRAKAKIESSYSQQQYDTFLSQLNGMSWSTPKTTTTTTTRATPQDTSRDQWNGNYVYNPSTWYYEKEWTARATQTTPTTKQDTPIKQQETVGTTTNEIKQQGVMKPLSQEYYNQTNDVALNQIRDNLNRYKQSNPEYFVNYDTFKNNFSYDARNEEQKRLLDDWYKWYQDGLSLASTPTIDLYNQYQNWSISAEQLEQLRVSDPTKYSELMNQINKWNIVAAYDDDKWTGITWNSIQEMAYQAAQQMFMQWMNGGNDSWASQYFAEYKANMDSPEMIDLQNKTTELQEQAKNIQDQIYDLQKDTEKEYEWTGASKSKINAIIADRTYELQQQLRTINNEYEKYATQYNNRMNQYQNEFQLQLQEYQINQQARQQKMNELWFALDLMSFQTPEQKKEMEWEFWLRQQEYQDGNINSKDPAVQLKAIQNSVDGLLQNYAGIPTIRSSTEIAQDIQTAIKNGSSLWAELTTLNKQMQSKPEYKLMYNATYNWKQTLGTINWKSAVISYDAAGNYIWYELLNTTPNSISNSNRSSQIKSFSDVWDISSNSWDNYVANLENAVQLGSWGWQCGAWANDILTGAWADKIFWNSLSDKIKVCDNKYLEYTNYDFSKLNKWDFVVLDTWAKLADWTPAGHVWLVKSIDLQNGKITVFDSNGQAGSKCWGNSTYNLGIVRGAYDPTQQSSNFTKTTYTPISTSEWQNAIASQNTPSYDEDYIPDYKVYLSKGSTWFTKDAKEQIKDAFGDWDSFVANANAYQDYLSQQAPEYLQNVIKYIENIRENLDEDNYKEANKLYKYENNQGFFSTDRQQNFLWLWTARARKLASKDSALEADVKQLLSSAALQNLVSLKKDWATFGALSDNELDFIKSSATNISLWLDYDDFVKNLDKYEKIINKQLAAYWTQLNPEPDMSDLQSQTNVESQITTRMRNWVLQYSPDGWITRF